MGPTAPRVTPTRRRTGTARGRSWARPWSTGRALRRAEAVLGSGRQRGPAELGGHPARVGAGRRETSATRSFWMRPWIDSWASMDGVKNLPSTVCSLGGSRLSARTWPRMSGLSGTPMARSPCAQTRRRGLPRCDCSRPRWSADSTKRPKTGPSAASSSWDHMPRVGAKARAACRAVAHVTHTAEPATFPCGQLHPAPKRCDGGDMNVAGPRSTSLPAPRTAPQVAPGTKRSGRGARRGHVLR
jgi:hypothetical protein